MIGFALSPHYQVIQVKKPCNSVLVFQNEQLIKTFTGANFTKDQEKKIRICICEEIGALFWISNDSYVSRIKLDNYDSLELTSVVGHPTNKQIKGSIISNFMMNEKLLFGIVIEWQDDAGESYTYVKLFYALSFELKYYFELGNEPFLTLENDNSNQIFIATASSKFTKLIKQMN